jgi:clan AA aspartic protease (TIGR02281 family)
MKAAMAKRLLALALLTIVDFCDVSLALAQSQKPNYLWDGWHKVPDPSHIQYKVFHDKVVALSNLSKRCDPGSFFSFAGKIAKLNFDSQGLIVENFVLEANDGERSLINVDRISMSDPGMDRADLGWIVQGLQTLLHPDLYIQGSALACGASGRVLVLDNILLASSTKPSKPLITNTLVPNKGVGEGQPQSQPAQTASDNAEGIPLSEQGGTFVIPVLINGQITLNFTIDSGAADVSIPADVVSTLMRTGTLQKSDFVGQKIYRLADGSTVPSATFLIRSLKVGNHLLENVTGSVASAEADLLLGQSFLSRFNSWSIDNKRQVLLLN